MLARAQAGTDASGHPDLVPGVDAVLFRTRSSARRRAGLGLRVHGRIDRGRRAHPARRHVLQRAATGQGDRAEVRLAALPQPAERRSWLITMGRHRGIAGAVLGRARLRASSPASSARPRPRPPRRRSSGSPTRTSPRPAASPVGLRSPDVGVRPERQRRLGPLLRPDATDGSGARDLRPPGHRSDGRRGPCRRARCRRARRRCGWPTPATTTRSRTNVRLYRVDEPAVDEVAASAITTARPDVWTLHLPGRPARRRVARRRPGRRAVRDHQGARRALRRLLPRRPRPGTAAAARGRHDPVHLHRHAGPVHADRPAHRDRGRLLADGTRLAVRTYTDAYVWRVRDGDVAAALRAEAHSHRAAVPARRARESASPARRCSSTARDSDTPVYRVRLPAVRTPGRHDVAAVDVPHRVRRRRCRRARRPPTARPARTTRRPTRSRRSPAPPPCRSAS